MAQYNDLPEELGRLFGSTSMPPEVRQLLRRGWDSMKPNEQGQLLSELRKERDSMKRVVVAVMEITKVMLSRPPKDELQI
jgi:hypothetical protein